MYKKWINTLKNVELFENIEENELNNMLLCLKPRIISYKKNEHISIKEDNCKKIGIIIQGEVIVSKENEAGNRTIMAKLKNHSMFGEMLAFSDNNKWITTVIASKDCLILFFTPEQVLGNCPKMCIGHKLLIQNMLKIVTKKGLNLNRKIEYLSMKSIRTKISTYLLEQYNATGKNSFNISLNRSELSEFLNVSRPSLSREIIKMKDEGIIDFYKCSFKIINIEKLKVNL